jgi:hypothetical protein
LSDFPTPGKSAVLTWQQSQQNFAVKLVGDAATVTATATTTTTTANAATTTTTTATGATTTTTAGSDALEGGRLFTTYCVCHTPADEVGRNSNEIHDAIVKDLGGMAILDFLTDRQISQIGLYLSLEELHPDHGN